MSQAFAGPEWTKNGSCRPRYIWHPDNRELQIDKHNQAARITLVKRQARSKNAKIESELYVCKWYPTAGLGHIGSGGTSISGWKYIRREAEVFASINHPNIVRFLDFSYELRGAQLAKLYMEYCPYGDLSQFARHRNTPDAPRLSYDEGGQVMNQLAQALLYLHHGVFKTDEELKLAKLDFGVFKSEGGLQLNADAFPHFETVQDLDRWKVILHRDVKPANGAQKNSFRGTWLTIFAVFVAERAHGKIKVRLGDFGLVKYEKEGTDTYVGSRDYFAPVCFYAFKKREQVCLLEAGTTLCMCQSAHDVQERYLRPRWYVHSLHMTSLFCPSLTLPISYHLPGDPP
jgi:serine/threonine protein kinase